MAVRQSLSPVTTNYNKRPEINNRGDIVYAKTSASSPSGYDLYLYSGSAHTHTQIGSGVESHLLYALNDQGQVAWVDNTAPYVPL